MMEYQTLMNELKIALVDDKAVYRMVEDKIEHLEQEKKQLHDSADDIEKELADNANLIIKLKSENEDLMVDLEKSRDMARSYAKDNELMNSTNRQLRSLLEHENRKSSVYAAALKISI